MTLHKQSLIALSFTSLAGLASTLFLSFQLDHARGEVKKARQDAMEAQASQRACLTSLATTQEQLIQQTVAVEKLEQESLQARAVSQAAVAQAKAQEARLWDRMAALRGLEPGADACATARAAIVRVLKEDRQ